MKLSVRVSGLQNSLKKLEQFADRFQDTLVAELQNELRARTPKDTGKASRGWRTQTSSTVVNRVPYIQRLERGWSQQAPNGFVKKSIAKAIQNTNRRMTE